MYRQNIFRRRILFLFGRGIYFLFSGLLSLSCIYIFGKDTVCVGVLVIPTIRMFITFPSVLMICVFGSALQRPSVKLMGEADENVSVWKRCPPAREAHGAKGPARSHLPHCEISISSNSMGASIYTQ